jgi:hypothetical protein
VTPALIDLHVRPVFNDAGQQDAELLAVQARDHGLDGLAVIAQDAPVALGETAEVSRATGVLLFAGVELATDAGRLVCFPRALDDWYQAAGWRTLPRATGVEGYAAEAVIRAFAERGGAVVAIASAFEGDTPARPAGLCALDVTAMDTGRATDDDAEDAPEEPLSGLDDAALQSAHAGRLACVAGSRAAPGEPRFGAIATVFASPPTSQESLVEALRSGRVWPVEIGAPWADAAFQPRRPTIPQPAAMPAPHGNGAQPSQTQGHVAPPVQNERQQQADRPPQGERQQRQSQGAPARKNGRYWDPQERPGDARGNRLNREALRRRFAPASDEGSQPAFDPVAAMYGLDGRKFLRHVGKSDIELDRINGNRSKGADPNVMVLPAFDELRQERQHINLLFCQTEEEDDESDSLSLTFALSYFQDEDGQPNRDVSQIPTGHQGRGQQQQQRRRRRR